MKPLLATSSGKNIQGVILVGGSSVVSDPRCVAEVFSDYFANNIQVEHRSDNDYIDDPSIKALSNRRFSSEFNYSLVSTSYVRNLLDYLESEKDSWGRRHFTTTLAFGILSSCRRGD